MSPDLKDLRAINRADVLNIIFALGPISRVRIARLTGLKKPTISSIVRDLIDEGLVYESSLDQTSLGRKPVNLSINEQYKIYGLIDVALWTTRLAVCDLGGHVLDARIVATVEGDAAGFLRHCAAELKEMLKKCTRELIGVSVILPCPLDSSRGFVYWHRTLGWNFTDVRALLSEEMECKVLVENDGRAGAMAELLFAREVRNVESFVHVLVTDGVGTGIVIGGRPYYGAHCLDGRIGFGLIRINGKWQEYSDQNSWEENASDRGAVTRYCELEGCPAPHEAGREMDRIIELARRDNRNAIQALKETARCLAAGIAGIYLGLDPERIVISGKITRVWDIVIDEIIEQLESTIHFHVSLLRELIVPSSLEDVTFLGGRALILRDLFGARFLPEYEEETAARCVASVDGWSMFWAS